MVKPKPTVYTATYSGIQVFEMSVDECTMMRRRSDSYLNATQILKLGGLDKGKRTKVLEREVISKTHEKIQGGYGKYQGTWVPLEIGRELAERYHVLDLLLPLVDFDPSTWSELPEKEQMPPRASRARTAFGNTIQPQTSPMPAYSSQQDPLTTTSTFKRKFALFDNDESEPPSIDFLPSSSSSSLHVPLALPSTTISTNATKKKPRIQAQPKPKQHPNDSANDSKGNKGNKSNTNNNSNNILSSPARSTIISKKEDGNDIDTEQHRNTLLSLFSSDDEDIIPSFFHGAGATTGIDWDLSIDEQGHTALHWSVALGRMHTVEWLISKGANAMMVNSAGETPLMRGVMTTSIYDHDCFPHMLDILRDSLSLVDYTGRTVLHHILLSTLESKTTAKLDVIGLSSVSNTRPSTTSSALIHSSSSSMPEPSAPLPSSQSSQSTLSSSSSLSLAQPGNRLLAAKSYMTQVLKTITQYSEHLHILNQPDITGETPYALARRLNSVDLCYLMEQSGCSLPADDIQLGNSVSSFLALPPPIPQKHIDQASKRTRKKVDKKQGKQEPRTDDSTTTKGRELASTVQRFVDSMDMEFSTKLQAKEADVSRMQQEIKVLTRQLDDIHKQQDESRKTETEQLEQAHTKIKQLEDILEKSGIRDLEIGTMDATGDKGKQVPSTSTSKSSSSLSSSSSSFSTTTICNNEGWTDREKQQQQHIIHLQSQLKETRDNAQNTELLAQTHAKTLESLVACKRLIAACCNLPLEKVDDFIGPLTLAIENDPPDLDFARVIGFMEKLRQHQQ
ncbi:unnamed protein product [Absidia cylindrospora]